MKNPIVELDGDEMARVLWKWVKDILIYPYVDLNTEYYDLQLSNRDKTKDKITVAAAEAIKYHKVGVKCATITPNDERQKEYNLEKIWKSPNATIRKIVGGIVFRSPITPSSISPLIPTWSNPITVARHSFGDIYASTSIEIREGTKVQTLLKLSNGSEEIIDIYDYEENGVFLTQTNLDSSIEEFAISCFDYALEQKIDMIFGTKDTVTGSYDNRFKNIFRDLYNDKYKKEFEKVGIKYTYTLIDNAIASVLKSNGNILWACKNYEGDLMSDMVATIFGSLSLMTSVLQSPNGVYEYEAAHGTITNHYHKYLKGEKTSSNPVAIIFAWANALERRGILDKNEELEDFGKKLKRTTLTVLEEGIITKDLTSLCNLEDKSVVYSEELLNIVAERI